ncbi:hypothetical protein JF66_11425 [Cryobacterium sp. MLB-32]|nr:hypothetical protein JF66_11425 [Cryobacterium sp. MLB-32]
MDLLAPCFCCQARQPFHFTSASDQVVCSFCVRHLGAEKADRRDKDHLRLWTELFNDEQDMHRSYVAATKTTIAERDASIAELTTIIEQLRALAAGRFDATPNAGVRGLLENDLIRRAERKTELASRQIDWAMAVVWRIGMLHHDDGAHPRHCICGRTIASCAEGLALDPVRTKMNEWEKKNVQLLHDGKRHGLPADHPAVIGERAR